jgi:hypothetical protein
MVVHFAATCQHEVRAQRCEDGRQHNCCVRPGNLGWPLPRLGADVLLDVVVERHAVPEVGDLVTRPGRIGAEHGAHDARAEAMSVGAGDLIVYDHACRVALALRGQAMAGAAASLDAYVCCRSVARLFPAVVVSILV